MADATREERRECVIREARRYRDALREWDRVAHHDPAESLELWRVMQDAEKALIAAVEDLDGTAGPGGAPDFI